MANNVNLIAEHIVDRYVKRICGEDICEKFVENDPSERVMAGMLSENRMELGLDGGYVENSETKFQSVPSISVTFTVKKNPAGVLYIKPRGLLFYNVNPEYSLTAEYMLDKYSARDQCVYQSIDELCTKYPEDSFDLPLTWKKVQMADSMGDGIAIRLDSLQKGTVHLQQQIGEKLSFLATEIQDEVRVIRPAHISFFDLQSAEKFRLVAGVSDERVCPVWNMDITCTAKDNGDTVTFFLQLVNRTETDKTGRKPGYLPKIFNACMDITGNEAVEFQQIELDLFKASYREREPVYVVAENVSAGFDKASNRIYTQHVPVYHQNRLKTKDGLSEYVRFDRLIEDPLGNLKYIYNAMKEDYKVCRREYRTYPFRSEAVKNRFKNSLDDYEQEIRRFKLGIDQIEFKDFVRRAFLYMNKTFQTKLGGETRAIPGWRLFQIVFVVSMIPEIIRSEYPDDTTLAASDIPMANLLYFPTGGGKTEAFLGACVFDMFFDRLRGKNDGITAFLKYPLRLLAVQQLDRVLTIVMKANVVREASPDLKRTTPFRVGFYAGKGNTPNKITSKEPLSDRGRTGKFKPKDLILESDQDTLDEYYRFIDTCPRCGKKMVHVHFNLERWTLVHVCENPDCHAGTLPIMIVDDEIYRYLPSLVVSVVDKMALLGTTNEFRMLFGQVKSRCPVHGFTVAGKCRCPNCAQADRLEPVYSLKDPVPTMFIQDELHLMTESLGTFDSHYESFIDYYARRLVPSAQQKQIRFIGATATIAMYQDHIRELYHMEGRRFPCEYPSVKSGEDFYSYTDNNDVSRIMIGYAPYGRSVTDGLWQSALILRMICYELYKNADTVYPELRGQGFEGSIDDYKELLYNYWIELVYNNRKADVVDLANAFQNQANNYLQAHGVPLFKAEQMTSDEDFQAVRKTLFDIQANHKNRDATNLLLATKTISHGVDEDSFNLMYFFGMPNNNAEYIQSYSRVGRKYTGIVIDIIRLMRIRDRSYLKNFMIFHENKDDLVESVPINRWAKNAIYQTLPGLLAGLIAQYYTEQTGAESLYFAYEVKRLLMRGAIDIDDAVQKLIEIYGCNDNEKLSIAYKEAIEEETHHILEGLRNNDFDKKVFLSDAIAMFSHGKLRPMTSLRDTEEAISVECKRS